MVRLSMKKIHIFVFLAFLTSISVQCDALTLLSPTEGQVVRENVRIVIPSADLPTEGFIAIYADDGTGDRFLVSMGRESAIKSGNNLIFIWNSKSTYFDPQDPSREKHYRDGNYVLTVKVLNRGGSVVDSAQVKSCS